MGIHTKTNMEEIFEEKVTLEDLKKFERIFDEQCSRGPPSTTATFDYAWCLVRSPRKDDIRKGVAILEDLYHKTADESAKRDYVYYLAIGNMRLGNYDRALKFTNGILKLQPSNHQAMSLREYIEKKRKKDGLIGAAVVGGTAALVIGGIAALGVALTKK